MTPEQEQFIALVAPGALATERTQGVPAAVTITQAILESGWGKTQLAKEGNLFGIKAGGDWSGDTVMMPTKEYLNGQWVSVNAKFRAYSDVADSIKDHADFLRSRKWYEDAFRTSTPDEFVRALVNAGEPAYATDPNYSNKVIALMDQYGLRDVGKKVVEVTRADLDAFEARITQLLADSEAKFNRLISTLAESARYFLSYVDQVESDGEEQP